MSKLKVALVQTSLAWRNAEENRLHFQGILKGSDSADVWVLPEMFTTGFTMEPQAVAEQMNGQTHQWMQQLAADKNGAIAGSLIIEENGKYFNRFLFVTPDGNTTHYDKRHLFTMADEHQQFTAGESLTVVEFKGVKMALQVCYDLRFPCFVRNNKNNAYDLILYTANWPQARIAAWDKLLLARAIENQCYVIAVNRVGLDGKDISYNGHSAAIDPYGDYIQAPAEGESVIFATIHTEPLQAFREKFPVLNDAD